MDKYSIGRAVAQNTTFPICKALMVSNAVSQTVVIHPYSYFVRFICLYIENLINNIFRKILATPKKCK